jgi:hypothetical protein
VFVELKVFVVSVHSIELYINWKAYYSPAMAESTANSGCPQVRSVYFLIIYSQCDSLHL